MEPWLLPEYAQFTDGDTAVFRCITSGSRPAAKVTWFVNGDPVNDQSGAITADERRDTDGTFSSRSQWTVAMSRDRDGVEVTCSVTNRVLEASGQGPRNASVLVVVQCE